MPPPVLVGLRLRSHDNRLQQGLVLDSRIEGGSKKFGGKLPGIGKDALDSTALLAWRLGELTQASNVDNDEQLRSEPSVSSLLVM